MNLDAAHDLMDLLLDKAEQPYFTDNEKNQFLDHAIMSFINFHYSFYDQEQVSRDALSYFFHDSDPSFGAQNAPLGTRNLPERYVHLIQFEVGTSANNLRSAKILGSKDYLDLRLSSDPFNRPTEDNPICFVRVGENAINPGTFFNQIHFQPATWPGQTLGPATRYFCIVFRPHDIVFKDTNVLNVSTSLVDEPLSELYQREVIDIAVRKMTGNIESPNIQYQQIEAEQSKSI